KFGSGQGISVYGKLIATGTSPTHVLFTSTSPTPAPGAWNAIRLYGGPDTLQYCDVSYATWGIAVYNTSTHFVSFCNVSNCLNYGLYGLNTGTSARSLIVQYSTI